MPILVKSTSSTQDLEDFISKEFMEILGNTPFKIKKDGLKVDLKSRGIKNFEKLLDVCKKYQLKELYINNYHEYSFLEFGNIYYKIQDIDLRCKKPISLFGGCDIGDNVHLENIIVRFRDSRTYEVNEDMEVINYKGHFIAEMMFYGSIFYQKPKNFTHKNSHYSISIMGTEFDIDKFYNNYKDKFDAIPLTGEIFWINEAKTYYLNGKYPIKYDSK